MKKQSNGDTSKGNRKETCYYCGKPVKETLREYGGIKVGVCSTCFVYHQEKGPYEPEPY